MSPTILTKERGVDLPPHPLIEWTFPKMGNVRHPLWCIVVREKIIILHENVHCDFVWLHRLCIILYTFTLKKEVYQSLFTLLYIYGKSN